MTLEEEFEALARAIGPDHPAWGQLQTLATALTDERQGVRYKRDLDRIDFTRIVEKVRSLPAFNRGDSLPDLPEGFVEPGRWTGWNEGAAA